MKNYIILILQIKNQRGYENLCTGTCKVESNENKFMVLASAFKENLYSDTGACAPFASWYFYKNTSTFSIADSGAVVDNNWRYTVI